MKKTRRNMDSNKLLWHMDRVKEFYEEGKRVSPILINIGASKMCNIDCVWCVSGNTKILMGNFTWKKIKDIEVGEIVMGFDEKRKPNKLKKNYAKYYPTKVTKTFKRKGRTHKISYGNNYLRITNEHKILCEGHRWRTIQKLKDKTKIRYFTEPYNTDFKENYLYKIGYLKGVCEGDASICSAIDKRKGKNNYEFRKFKLKKNDVEMIDKCEKYFKDLFDIYMSRTDKRIIRTDKKKEVNLIEKALHFRKESVFYLDDFARGYLAGIFDTEGSFSGSLRIAQIKHKGVIANIQNALKKLDFDFVKEKVAIRIKGGFSEISRFFGICKPTIKRKIEKFYNRSIPKTIVINKHLGGRGGIEEEVYNLATESQTYVANGFCVHNCYGVYQGRDQRSKIEREPLLSLFRDAPRLGVKAIEIIGDGEPTMNPDIYDAMDVGRQNGLDMAFSTNGVLLKTDERRRNVLRNNEWMRFSISAGTRDQYRKLHQRDRFEQVTENIERMVELNESEGYGCDIGLQAVFVPDLMNQAMLDLSDLAVKLGVDYLEIKQCSLPEGNESVADVEFDVNRYDDEDIQNLLDRCEAKSTEKTEIMSKRHAMKLKGTRPYDHCLDIPFLVQMSGNGKMYPCGYLFGNEKYEMGDIHKNSLQEILSSDRYWSVVNHMVNNFDVHKDCEGHCRHDSTNKFISDYLNKPESINFI